MSRKIVKHEPVQEYKPKIAKCVLHTAGKTVDDYRKELTGQGFTVNDFKHMVKAANYFDGLTVYLSMWDYDRHENWHLWNWEKENDERIMCAMFEAEHYNPASVAPISFEEFRKLWETGEYDPGCSYCFAIDQVEVLEVLQEEQNPHDSERTRQIVRREKEKQYLQKRKKQKEQRKKQQSKYKKWWEK